MTQERTPDESHYLGDRIDRLYVAAARDALFDRVSGDVLNVGIGYGTWDERLAERQGAGGSTTVSLDISRHLVAEFASRYPRIDYVCADVFDYRPRRKFGTIVASHFLEHVDDPVRLLRLFHGWLQPAGRILVVVPNAESIHRQLGQKMGLLAALTDLNDADRLLGHKRVYTRRALEDDIGAAGRFSVRSMEGLTFKPLANAQLASMPRAYVDACLGLHPGDAACQLGAELVAV